MFVFTLSRKRAFQTALVVLAVFVGIAVGIAAILTAINTGAAETKVPIYSVERADNKIAITFDCAWGNSNTDELLKILNDNDVYATFFVTGEFCDKYPDDVRKIAKAGHEIANHSDKHPHIKGMNINSLIADTKECERKIQMLTGSRPTLYRSPYGEYDSNSIIAIEGLGYKFIQWSVDSIDWQEPDEATIIKRITDKTVSGSILLFHNDLENTEKALPEVITKLRQAGFEFVKTSDLIYKENYNIDSTGKQIPEVKVTGIGTVSQRDDAVTQAVAIIKANLTFEEIASMKNGISDEIASKIAPFLSLEQIEAITRLTKDELNVIIADVTEANAQAQNIEQEAEQEAEEQNAEPDSVLNNEQMPTADPYWEYEGFDKGGSIK